MEDYLYSQLVEEASQVDDSSDYDLAEDAAYVAIDMLHLLRRGVPTHFVLLNWINVELDLEINNKTEQERWRKIFASAQHNMTLSGDPITERDIYTPHKLYNLLETPLEEFCYDDLLVFRDEASEYELDDICDKLDAYIKESYPFAELTDKQLNLLMVQTDPKNVEVLSKLYLEQVRRSTCLYGALKSNMRSQDKQQALGTEDLKLVLILCSEMLELLITANQKIPKATVANLSDIFYVEFDQAIDNPLQEARIWCGVQADIIKLLSQHNIDVTPSYIMPEDAVDFNKLTNDELDLWLDLLLHFPDIYKSQLQQIGEILCQR